MSQGAVVVGAGPNGLAAAIRLAQAGHKPLVIEGQETVGGGCRSAQLTRPGFVHDVCSAIFGIGLASPFFRRLPLAEHGVEWIHPAAPLAHPLDDGTAVVLERSVAATAEGLGPDAGRYRRVMLPFAQNLDRILRDMHGPLRLPRHPLVTARMALLSFWPAAYLGRALFRGQRARALFAGVAAHSMLPLERPVTSGFAFMLASAAHAVGWPLVRGGSQVLADALASILRSLGGDIRTGRLVESLEELPPAEVYLFDTAPRALARIAGEALPQGYRRSLGRFRYGPGVFKIDWALDGPLPWRAKETARAATVHLGGTLEEIAEAERAPWQARHAERPYVILVQPTLFDPGRAPEGKHTAWAYCHVPNGSGRDMTQAIEAQVERFAPGFRDHVLERHTYSAAEMEAYNPNYVGGDINGGAQDLFQFFTRPVARLVPYATPDPRIYLCSSSTPPGGGVHGMCGCFAAEAALGRRAGGAAPGR